MLDEELVQLLRNAARAVGEAIVGMHGRGLSGRRASQYHADVAADDAALGVLLDGGVRVLSEESGSVGEGDVVVVVDPIDGSTNFDRGIPYYATSLCALDDAGARCSVVVNLATDTWYEAVRGGGATRDGAAIHPSSVERLEDAVVSFSGFPVARGPWAQYRALGAAALELCEVADGSLDAFAVVGSARLSPWDYLGGLLVLAEAGAPLVELEGAPLVVAEAVHRRPVAAATPSLLDAVRAFAAASSLRGRTVDRPGA